MAEIHHLDRLNGEVHDGDDLVCTCGDYLAVIGTCYGFRAICRGCRVRWTLIHGEPFWIEERYSPMTDNLDGRH